MDVSALLNSPAGPSNEAPNISTHEEGYISNTASGVTAASTASGATTYSKPNMLPFMTAAALQSETNLKDSRYASSRVHEEGLDADHQGPRLRSSRTLKGKGKESLLVEREEKKPLRLLELPVDILKEIVKEVTHTNDLTSLALCHSALHRLTIPHIYSRFDIVWPDSSAHAEPRSGVDALTHGLATLVMAEEVFGESPSQQQQYARENRFNPRGSGPAAESLIRRRRGNHYAQFTRKFSLGNGPVDWVQEYLITKEGGKMLGTLVALAVARMRSLETFVWDMPTGILRDVWLALSSLEGRGDGVPCRLDKVWVRWHENTPVETIQTSAYPPAPPLFPDSPLPQSHVDGPPDVPVLNAAQPPPVLARVERPSFSVLPPLKSLSVLDIDELAYLDEMSVLVGRSLDKLRELRVGIARHAMTRDWVAVWEGEGVLQVDAQNPTAGSFTIGEKRLGGVLGVLTGFVHDMRQPKTVLPTRAKQRQSSNEETGRGTNDSASNREDAGHSLVRDSIDATSLRDILPDLVGDGADAFVTTGTHTSEPVSGNLESLNPAEEPIMHGALDADADAEESPAGPLIYESGGYDDSTDDTPAPLNNMLRLEVLELERVPICVPILQKAINFPNLTSLTLLHCPNHEQLWKTLRRAFTPTPKPSTYPHPRRTPGSTPRKSGRLSAAIGGDCPIEYHLNLKKLHTNTVSPGLISFLKETLAPNSLEILFLQDSRNSSTTVTIDHIFRGPIRRHRASLKKLLLDSSEKTVDGLAADSSRWRRWIINHDILDFVCSGRMPALRELGVALEYRDWHFFLQNLPAIPHLRSLYIPFLANHVHGANIDPRELALQIVDIVALRPEIELCYMGISTKCFEILENRRGGGNGNGPGGGNGGGGASTGSPWATGGHHGGHPDGRPDSQMENLPGPHGGDVDEEDEEGGEEEVEDDEEGVVEEEDEEHEEEETESELEDEDDVDDGDDDETDSDGEGAGLRRGRASAARLRLREILFYDDKVAVFKARHGRL